MVEGFVLRLAGGALRVPIVGPGGMRCQITFTSPHLMDPPRREAVEAHEGVGCRGGFVEVVQGRWWEAFCFYGRLSGKRGEVSLIGLSTMALIERRGVSLVYG